MSKPSIVALIPARANSKRVPNKNIRELGGHPLLAWTIASAKDSGIFEDVVVSTESPDIAQVAVKYGATVPFLRPPGMATDISPDIEWVRYTMQKLPQVQAHFDYDAFAILRPTSPFRTAKTIRRAWREFHSAYADSLRAVEKCSQHPYKMWLVNERFDGMEPLFRAPEGEHPWHSTQYAAIPEIYVQNSSLEIAWTRVLDGDQAQAGNVVVPFFTGGHEGLAIDYPQDFERAEALLERGEVSKPDGLSVTRPSVGWRESAAMAYHDEPGLDKRSPYEAHEPFSDETLRARADVLTW